MKDNPLNPPKLKYHHAPKTSMVQITIKNRKGQRQGPNQTCQTLPFSKIKRGLSSVSFIQYGFERITPKSVLLFTIPLMENVLHIHHRSPIQQPIDPTIPSSILTHNSHTDLQKGEDFFPHDRPTPVTTSTLPSTTPSTPSSTSIIHLPPTPNLSPTHPHSFLHTLSACSSSTRPCTFPACPISTPHSEGRYFHRGRRSFRNPTFGSCNPSPEV